MYITGDLVTNYGMAGGHDGCATRSCSIRSTRPHPQRSRERTLEAMVGDEKGMRRKLEHEERIGLGVAAQLEREERRTGRQTCAPGRTKPRGGDGARSMLKRKAVTRTACLNTERHIG